MGVGNVTYATSPEPYSYLLRSGLLERIYLARIK